MKQPLRSARPWSYLAVALLFAGFTFAVFAALTRHAGHVTDVVVEVQPTPEGLFLIESKDIEQRLDAGPQGALLGQTIKDLALEDLERFLELDPFVADADLYTGFDGNLHVTILQNEPILRVHNRRGTDYYIGPGGDVLPLSKHDVSRVPVLTGQVANFEDAVADSTALEAFVLADALRSDDLLHGLIEQIELKEGAYTLIPKLGTAAIKVGDLDNLDNKLHRLRIFLRGALPEVGWEAYSHIDLSYAGQVVCRKRRGATDGPIASIVNQ